MTLAKNAEKDKGVSLVRVLKDPRGCDYECEYLEDNGHLYIYRYVAGDGVFLRATVPSGAAAPVFRQIDRHGKVPVLGWFQCAGKPVSRPRLVKR